MRRFFSIGAVRALLSVRLGIVLGLASSALLGLSSLLIPAPRSEEALPFSESFAPFVDSVEPRYWWFYLLAILLALLALNVLLSTLRSTALRPRAQWDLRFAGIVLLHVGLIGGLATHLVAGLSAEVEQSAVLTRRTPTEVAGRDVRLVSVEPESNPDGSLRTASAVVTVGGERATLGYNDPVFLDGMRRFVLVQDLRPTAGGAAFAVDGERVVVEPGERFGRAGAGWILGRTSTHPSLRAPMAVVRPADAPRGWRWIRAGQPLGGGVVFEGVTRELAVAVVVRRNDGVPVLVGASVVFTVGLVMFLVGRRRRRRGKPAPR